MSIFGRSGRNLALAASLAALALSTPSATLEQPKVQTRPPRLNKAQKKQLKRDVRLQRLIDDEKNLGGDPVGTGTPEPIDSDEQRA